MMRMDQNAPRESQETKPLKPARVALNVLALCFALSVLGRGLVHRPSLIRSSMNPTTQFAVHGDIW